jgi:hypothetical protein
MPVNWKTVRVFISSTFRDMQAERGHLVRFVFPRLREQLLPRRIHLLDVDLRWGVTSEQDASEVCREIITECRPRFLCILGGRYGTIPQGKDLSITADEVHFGVLDEHREKIYALFYFRHGAVTEKMDQSNPASIREPRHSEKTGKLARLKREIRKVKHSSFLYRPRWNTDEGRLLDLKAFGDRVAQDILATIDDEFGAQPPAQLDEFGEESAAMEAFVEERGERFVLGSREGVLEQLLAHASATGGNGYVCLTGAPGSGKSALLAYLSQHSTLKSRPSTTVIRHFVGASTGSTDVRRTLRRLCHELATDTGITAEIPEDPEKLRAAFPEIIKQACARKRVVILLDAVNQFDFTTQFSKQGWLPEELPDNARFILSLATNTQNAGTLPETSPSPRGEGWREGERSTKLNSTAGERSERSLSLADLRRRRQPPKEVKLKSLDDKDCEAIIQHFLTRYRKKLEPQQKTGLLKNKDSGTPLYLLAALEELRTLGTYEEITDRIAQLPPETQALFTWILKRLEDDDGFRDNSGRKVGPELVPQFALLMGASRHGLSQRELAELLAPGDPNAKPPIPDDAQGNVAALVQLLRPYLMRRGELLDFYHGQFRAAAEKAYLQTAMQCHTAHEQLADYFRRKADPDNKQLWKMNARALAEMPFHLICGEKDEEVRRLFSSLSYLAARVAIGQIYEQLADFAFAGTSLPSAVAEWHEFLKKHTQRLVEYPAMLVALTNHEGFPAGREQAATSRWAHPWLKTSPEAMPPSTAAVADGLRTEVVGSLDFPRESLAALADERGLVFRIERLGVLRVLDVGRMRLIDTVLSIRHERPLLLACASDATFVAVFYESGEADLHRCVQGTDERPARLDLVTTFQFHLPECEDPVVAWHDGAVWFQARANVLAHISIGDPQVFEETLLGTSGELSALVFAGGARLVALREGSDSLLLASGAAPLWRLGTDVISACSCGAQRAAVAFTDGTLLVYDLAAGLATRAEKRVGIVRGALGWDGMRLLWLTDRGGFFAWRPEKSSALPVQDNQEVFPRYLDVLPRWWSSRSTGTVLLITTHSVVAFHLFEGGATIDGRLEEFFGGPVWRVVHRRDKEKEEWLIESQPSREVLLGRGVLGRFYCAPDGKGRFFAASGYGPGWVYDLTTLHKVPIQGCPPRVNTVVGDADGGCWLVDGVGDIFFIDSPGVCRRVASVNLEGVSGAQIHGCGDCLVWYGYSTKFYPETGVEAARTMVFFRRNPPGFPPRLERIGERLLHMREGICQAICYDRLRGRLVTVWAVEGSDSLRFRLATVEDFIAWNIEERELSDLGPKRFKQAVLSPDGHWVGVLNVAGEFSCVRVADGRTVATLAASTPFAMVSPGADGTEFWLVTARIQVYRCELMIPP